jgi:hypothetical protein
MQNGARYVDDRDYYSGCIDDFEPIAMQLREHGSMVPTVAFPVFKTG